MEPPLTGDWIAWKWEMSPYWRDYQPIFARLDEGTLWPALPLRRPYDGETDARDLWDRP